MLFLALSLVLQTPATEPPAATAPTSVLPVTRAATRQGVAVVAVAAPAAPWAVVQLHLRLAGDDVSPRARAATLPWLSLVAEAGRRYVGPTGTVELRVTPEHAAISFGVEAARVDDALRAVDASLRARGNRPPATAAPSATTVPALSVVDDGLDAGLARLLLAGNPRSLPIDGGALDAAVVKVLADAVAVDRVAVVVVADDNGAGLVARVNRIVTAPLGKALGAASVTTLPASARLELLSTSWSSTLTLTTTAPTDASLLVLASLLQGRSLSAFGVSGFSIDVAAGDRQGLLAKEAALLDQIDGVAAAAPPAEVVERARAQVLSDRFSVLNNPDRVAWALGRVVFGPRPTQIEDEYASLSTLTPAQVSQAAAQFSPLLRNPPAPASAASLLIVRKVGLEKPAAQPVLPTAAKTLPTTTPVKAAPTPVRAK